MAEKEFLTAVESAEYLGISRNAFDGRVQWGAPRGNFPWHAKTEHRRINGRTIEIKLWRIHDLEPHRKRISDSDGLLAGLDATVRKNRRKMPPRQPGWFF